MISKIMVVDDEPDLEVLITQKYRRKIRNNEFEFVFARNGVDAMNKLQNNGDIDIVLTDINMPEMDGLTLLANINEKYPLLKSVIVSAYGDMANIRTAFNRGAFDFLTKPIDFQDLEITIDKTLQEAHLLKEAEKNRNRLAALQNELDIAREIQAAMVPQKFPPFPNRKEFEVFANMIPAKKVGGDFYDFFFVDADHLGFVIGDVSGKGVPAALFMAVSRTLIKSTAIRSSSTADCLSQVNKLLRAEKTNAMFVTVFYGILNTQTGEVEYSNGGHNPPLIIRSDQKIRQSELTDNFVVGAISSTEYHVKKIHLQPGDSILLHTDGVTEAMNQKNEQYSEERLIQCLENQNNLSVVEMVQKLSENVSVFTADAEQSDDITIMALKYLG
jgi:sigma-B regulation protein RsbU (phosphoserine phosphatase)